MPWGRKTEGDVLKDISILENKSKFIAVIQGGVIKAGRLAVNKV